jgi:signal transduction histidine kinase
MTGRRLALVHLPRSLFGRLMLILILGLFVSQALSFGLAFYERTQSSLGLMMRYVGRDVASSVAILERESPDRRADWLQRLDRRNYRYTLGVVAPGDAVRSSVAQRIVDAIGGSLGPSYRLKATELHDGHSRLLLQLDLRDGSPIALEFSLKPVPLSPWMVSALCMQFLLLVTVSWLAVRWVIKPLIRLAEAADTLATDFVPRPLPEVGTVEVVRATRAFNVMQRRIDDHLKERMQILAAISHDLQTPITRMRLRADLLDDAELRERLHDDLNAMQALVSNGIAYARDGHGVTETSCLVDLDALLDSIVNDYVDSGKAVTLCDALGEPVIAHPNALRRIVVNLIDNALKFGQQAEVRVGRAHGDGTQPGIEILVLDHGPGIPEAQIESVLKPFYRLEHSRNRETGGSGLGLAIAQQLTHALGGRLQLSNRECGGLKARIWLPNVREAGLSTTVATPGIRSGSA